MPERLEGDRAGLREALEAVKRNDKTPPYEYGGRTKASVNREGKAPGEGRWKTPREIADAALPPEESGA